MNKDGYNAVVLRVDNIVKHPNANKLQVIDLGGVQVVVGLSVKFGDLAMYFKEKTQIAEWFLKERNLYRHIDKNDDKDAPTGFFEDNGVVRSIRLRGVYSQGFLYFPTQDEIVKWKLKENNLIDEVNNMKLCWKFEPFQGYSKLISNNANKRLMFNESFKRYGDTPSIVDVINTIPVGAGILVTNKLHGTSGRTGKFIVEHKWSWKNPLSFLKMIKYWFTGKNEYHILTGSRNVDLYAGEVNNASGYRYEIHQRFNRMIDLMNVNETFYYEIVGYDCNTPIQQIDDQVFHYGQTPGTFEIYVYAIRSNDTWLSMDEMVHRCQELNLNVVPVLDGFIFTSKTDLIERLYEYDKLYSSVDPLGQSHICEGVVLNIKLTHLPAFKAKYKFTKFCELENIKTYAGKLDVESVS